MGYVIFMVFVFPILANIIGEKIGWANKNEVTNLDVMLFKLFGYTVNNKLSIIKYRKMWNDGYHNQSEWDKYNHI